MEGGDTGIKFHPDVIHTPLKSRPHPVGKPWEKRQFAADFPAFELRWSRG